ncbi:Na/Pi symporter [candidate division WOR-3 bacterium]|nr:Na/Pi symporter [candidate division WOR-3 bacterium]
MLRLLTIVLLVASASASPGLGFAALAEEDISGNNQAGEAGLELKRPLAVQVTDSNRPVPGVRVRFRVLSEPAGTDSARLSDTLVTTDPLGFARSRLRLGAAPGDYRVRVTARGDELVFAATALRRRWYLVTVIELLGGLALFLFGLYYGSKGLRRLAGGRLRQLLFSLTSNRVLGALVGVVVTVVFQSSGATTVLLIGMASAGILGLGQALGVILGADIGTTITVQVLAFRLFDYALAVAVLGFILMNAHRRLRDAGQAIFGFGLVFFSLKVVLTATEPLNHVPQVTGALAGLGAHPWLGLLFALVFTALVRSSAATIGIVVGLSFSGLIDLAGAVPFILGANIGTSFAAVLASWRTGVEARRIAFGHVLFKVIIVGACLPLLPWLTQLVAATAGDLPRQVANAHTLINLAALVLFLPLLTPYRKLIERLVRPRPGESFGPRYLAGGAVESPELAVAQATREVLRMADRVQRMYHRALAVFIERDKTGRREVVATDDQVDRLETDIIGFLARISQEELNEEQSRKTAALYHVTDHLEHIADIVSKSLMAHARKRIEEGLAFSDEGIEEIRGFHAEVGKNIQAAIACITTWDQQLARRLAACKDWGNARQHELQARHLERLCQGLKPTLDTSSVHLDFIADLERVNFHCSRIGAAVAGLPARPARRR